MKIIIIIEYFVNLILLLIFSMHMFQLNSYLFKKHMSWMKKNISKHILQMTLVLIPGVMLCFNNIVLNVISAVILAFSIIYNIPKTKSKISLKCTPRVIRMFVTEILIIVVLFLVLGVKNYVLEKLIILNVISCFLCIFANLINKPEEKLVKKKYINEAKKILEGMPNLIVIGVTGSYGKTSVKNFLYKVLSSKYEVLKTPKNYNTTMGVVKTIRENLKATHQIFICEMGATHVGDIKEICDIVNPKLGIITSIGPQHLESFGSIDNVIKTKFELADSVIKNGGTVFLNYDNEYILNKKIEGKKITYGINNKNLNYNAYDLTSSSKGLSFKTLNKKKEEFEFKTKLIGNHNVANILAAISVADYLGVDMKKTISKVREIESVEHRLQLIPHGDLSIIDDSYNSNPISSKAAIDTLGQFEGTKIVVTPGLIELGGEEEKYNFELGEYATKVCDYIILVGQRHSKPIFDGIKSTKFDMNKVFVVSSPQEAMEKIGTLKISGKVTVLLENDLPDNYN